jgi:hypothetical protein
MLNTRQTQTAGGQKSVERKLLVDKKEKGNCWWTKECAIARRRKNKALTKYRNHLGNQDLWIAFKQAQGIFRKTVCTARMESWRAQ